MKFCPLMTTVVPPLVLPEVVLRPLTTGAGETNVYWSAALVAEVPAELVTVISTEPADSAGATAVIEVLEFVTKLVAATFPNLTAVMFVKLVPRIVTWFPPAVLPLVVERPVTLGVLTGAVNVNWSAEVAVEVTPAAVIRMSAVPGVWLGVTRLRDVGELTVNEVAFVPPTVTAVTFVKPVPVTCTVVPPEPVPVLGLIEVTLGPLLLKVYWSWLGLAVELPAEVTTMTSTAPAAWEGAVTMSWVEENTLKEVAAVLPNRTDETFWKLVPVTVMGLPPPAVEPLLGETPVTVGAPWRYVNWSAETMGELPVVVSTWMFTVPGDSSGAIAVIDELEFTVNPTAGCDPKKICVTPVNPLP